MISEDISQLKSYVKLVDYDAPNEILMEGKNDKSG